MKRVILAFVMALLCGQARADGIDGMPPPHGGTYETYYEDETAGRLGMFLLVNNVCFERFAQLNPDLDYTGISYGTKVVLPRREPCYDINSGFFHGDRGPSRLTYYVNGDWVQYPYHSEHVRYVSAHTVEEIAERYNVCVDDLLAHNIALQLYPLGLMQIGVTLDVFVPPDLPPCSPPQPPRPAKAPYAPIWWADYRPVYVEAKYGVCHEAINGEFTSWWIFDQRRTDYMFSILPPADAPPCRDARGRRLTYYDHETGLPLDTPRYSDLPVYALSGGMLMETAAQLLGVCMVDLLRVNGYRDLTHRMGPVDIFVPPARPCPDDRRAVTLPPRPPRVPENLIGLSIFLDICMDTLVEYNPPLAKSSLRLLRHWSRTEMPRLTLVLPSDPAPCYTPYRLEEGQTVYDLERQVNVCYERMITQHAHVDIPEIGVAAGENTIWAVTDALPCYDDAGRRLRYPAGYHPTMPESSFAPPEYSPLTVDYFAAGDTVYALSKQYNVCVEDILALNPPLVAARPRGLPVFIPDTPPCYDAATGLLLIYKDENGEPLTEPRVGEHVIYYGAQNMQRVSYYYNVCVNRIDDANRLKREQQVSYLGLIIPTDRPPCYDVDGDPIYYACYDAALDMQADYRAAHPPVSVNPDGTHCYDLDAPETVVWHHNRPYIVIDYDATLLESRAFTAWCYGVDLAEMNAINENGTILSIIPRRHRAIPLPTRDCYVRQPSALDRWGMSQHVVAQGETLHTIARAYGMPAPLLHAVNGLDADSTLWPRQVLLIPDAPYRAVLIGVGALAALGAGLMLRRVRRRRARS